ncbi:MlaD family protein [Desulfovibrio ferrophilus]|uniref:Mce/MlaD domain-containing protein n=1 Tax=Desulfovibrio ferrophilus TaxID=241368 RepID=A0A2Z6AWH2_9BACT|nr:MlaD family protein [Desulfovibrio ferrophilus]BBD07594.1 uncharacterized protein DFE_0868 [Desulfovibrio ferrophilus]
MSTRHETMELRVGAFVLIFVAVLIGTLIVLGIKKDLFSDYATFYVISTTGENVERGTPVRLSGFRIGNVNDVDLSHVGRVIIEIDILDKYREWFRQDSQIILVQGGIIGKTYLQLAPGSQNSPVLEEYTQVELNRIGGLDEIIAEAKPVIEDLKVIVANIRAITAQLLDKDGPVQSVLVNLGKLSEDLRSDKGLVGYLTKNPEPVQKLDSLLANTDMAMSRMTRLVDATTERVEDLEPLQKEAVSMMQEVNSFVKELKQFRTDIQPAVDNSVAITEDIRAATTDLARLRARTEHTIRLGTELLERLNNTWPLSRGLGSPAPEEHPAP